MRPLKLYTTFCLLFYIILCSLVKPQSANSQSHSSKQPVTYTATVKNQTTEDFSPDWYAQATTHIKQLEENFYPAGNAGAFRVANSTNHIGFVIAHNGYSAHAIQQQPGQQSWEVNFLLQGIGKNSRQWTPAGSYAISNQQGNLTYSFTDVNIEYKNNEDGLRQNFIVKKKPGGKGALTVAIELNSVLQPALLPGNKLVFHTAGNTADIKLQYEDLHVWDANHNTLPASMKLSNNLLTIEVDDSNAAYPITIDPINKSSEWNTSVDGVISGLGDAQLKAALYGFTVAGLGDVNGDGYGDAAISAPALVNVFSGSGSLASVGAVFVFYGSAAGLSATPNKTLQPNTAIAGALFGFSIDAGDVTGDGINDIIIGAPADRINLTIGILPVNGSVGKVYVYPGGTLTAPNPSNFLSLQLNTSHIGLLNITNNALFGFSVAVTEDMNGDNKKDILIGSPNYSGDLLTLVKTGGAFLYLSNASNTFSTIQKLEVPTFSLLGISIPLLNSINGLLYGYSVDGTGDYNGDGKADLVVGAPAGVDLSGLTGILTGQVLGGQALVYYGKSDNSGVTTSIGTRLQAASTGLLSNAANLFGYKVKGVKSVNGTRNGNIVIGAPVGGLIPNALSLTIQTGNVHVFKKKASSPSGVVTSDQVLESPRSSSLLQVLNTLDLNVLFGTALDNAYDVNCDGFPDLVVGEPLSSGTTLAQLQANAVGGAAYVFLGTSTGGYVSTPVYDASANYGSEFLSVNATSLFGFSVAGVSAVKGVGAAPRILVGSPSGALDFDNGVLNLGATLGLLYDFAAGDNGLGKSYLFHLNLCSSGSTLPVTITDFSGREKSNAIELAWETKDEVNVNTYEVQKGSDGINFETIALVFSNDNSLTNHYRFTDKRPFNGANYYRLLIADKDGKKRYSNTISFKTGAVADIVISPNPVVNHFRLSLNGLTAGTYRVELRNVTGQLQLSKSIQVNSQSQQEHFNKTGSMVPGIYWVMIYDQFNQRIDTKRIIVQ